MLIQLYIELETWITFSREIPARVAAPASLLECSCGHMRHAACPGTKAWGSAAGATLDSLEAAVTPRHTMQWSDDHPGSHASVVAPWRYPTPAGQPRNRFVNLAHQRRTGGRRVMV